MLFKFTTHACYVIMLFSEMKFENQKKNLLYNFIQMKNANIFLDFKIVQFIFTNIKILLLFIFN